MRQRHPRHAPGAHKEAVSQLRPSHALPEAALAALSQARVSKSQLTQLSSLASQQRRPKLVLTDEIIIDSARDEAQLTGKLPTASCLARLSRCPEASWQMVNSAAVRGSHGLPPGRSLSVILAPLRAALTGRSLPAAKPIGLRPPPLIEREIVKAARQHFKEHGKLPSHHTLSPIPTMPGESWRAIDQAGFQGHRGLRKGRTLTKILEPLREKLQYRTALSHNLINSSLRTFFELHAKLPTPHCRLPVPGLATSWSAVHVALRRGLRGLPGGESLPQLLGPLRKELGIDKTLSEPEILAAARAFYSEHGKMPSQLTQEPVPGRPHDSWRKINAAGQLGIRGLRKGRTLPVILAPLRAELLAAS